VSQKTQATRILSLSDSLCSVCLGTVLHKDKKFAIDFTCEMKKLLLHH